MRSVRPACAAFRSSATAPMSIIAPLAASARMYYRLILPIGLTRASIITCLIPVFGALLVWAILGEPLTWTMLLAGALILGSVAFSQKAR